MLVKIKSGRYEGTYPLLCTEGAPSVTLGEQVSIERMIRRNDPSWVWGDLQATDGNALYRADVTLALVFHSVKRVHHKLDPVEISELPTDDLDLEYTAAELEAIARMEAEERGEIPCEPSASGEKIDATDPTVPGESGEAPAP